MRGVGNMGAWVRVCVGDVGQIFGVGGVGSVGP